MLNTLLGARIYQGPENRGGAISPLQYLPLGFEHARLYRAGTRLAQNIRKATSK